VRSLLTRLYDVGPRTWSYFVDGASQPSADLDDPDADLSNLLPSTPVVTFGRLDPDVPSVCAVEFAPTDHDYVFLFTVKTPFSRVKALLGRSYRFADIGPILEDFFAGLGGDEGAVLPDWIHVGVDGVADSAFAGLVRLGRWASESTDLGLRIESLLDNADDPWMRFGAANQTQSRETYQDVATTWADVLFMRELHASAQLYMRSVWEDADLKKKGEPGFGGESTSPLIYAVRDRLMADQRFRGGDGPWLVHPYTHVRPCSFDDESGEAESGDSH